MLSNVNEFNSKLSVSKCSVQIAEFTSYFDILFNEIIISSVYIYLEIIRIIKSTTK